MKGIILAGGVGSRLWPLTAVTSKQLLPVYDKPMIYYPLSTLMLAGIRDILIITSPADHKDFEKLLGDGRQFGISVSYKEQPSPDGIAQAFVIGEEFIGGEACTLILGDNLFYGNGFSSLLRNAAEDAENGISSIFACSVPDPERFGVVEFDDDGNAVSIEEKPECPKSNYCVTGLYFYNKDVCEYAKTLTPSARGEYEITDLNMLYLAEEKLRVKTLGRGFTWIDAGTPDSLCEASDFVRMLHKRHGIGISVPEEIAYKNGWISRDEIVRVAEKYGNSTYGQHLRQVAEEKIKY